jgi:hypothetical protein
VQKLYTELLSCKHSRQLLKAFGLALAIVLALFSTNIVYAKEKSIKNNQLCLIPARNPANFVPNEEITYVPGEQPEEFRWIDHAMAEDDAGVMRGVKDSINEWQEKEEFKKLWDLESIGVYKTPTTSEKSSFLRQKALHYADKRLAGEIKNAEPGSTLKKLDTVQKALTPSSTVPVSKTVKVKFKARVLQGKAMMVVDNPYIDYQATAKVDGKVHMETAKELKALGMRTSIRYEVNEGIWVAAVDKKITETVNARVSSQGPNNRMFFTRDTERRFEMTYSSPF